MPTLFRLLVAIAFIAGLAYAGMFALTVLVEPEEREVTVRIPTRDLLADTP
ncbi:MAG TPA: histidine kinase [Pelagibacterium sp.]|uniref:histidine kinase n=1 Tax=Pelagibacterium sp. TaxID=1967288 RepID=UPI002D11159E|nr:histidine kinase [Pelagibacterium sp.]HWJ87128.1 histidine kinase [Pelagibacterium sp.]